MKVAFEFEFDGGGCFGGTGVKVAFEFDGNGFCGFVCGFDCGCFCC